MSQVDQGYIRPYVLHWQIKKIHKIYIKLTLCVFDLTIEDVTLLVHIQQFWEWGSICAETRLWSSQPSRLTPL